MHNENETPQTGEPELAENQRHSLALLSNIYLQAGLPLDLAVQSALADCTLFEEELLCA